MYLPPKLKAILFGSACVSGTYLLTILSFTASKTSVPVAYTMLGFSVLITITTLFGFISIKRNSPTFVTKHPTFFWARAKDYPSYEEFNALVEFFIVKLPKLIVLYHVSHAEMMARITSNALREAVAGTHVVWYEHLPRTICGPWTAHDGNGFYRHKLIVVVHNPVHYRFDLFHMLLHQVRDVILHYPPDCGHSESNFWKLAVALERLSETDIPK